MAAYGAWISISSVVLAGLAYFLINRFKRNYSNLFYFWIVNYGIEKKNSKSYKIHEPYAAHEAHGAYEAHETHKPHAAHDTHGGAPSFGRLLNSGGINSS